MSRFGNVMKNGWHPEKSSSSKSSSGGKSDSITGLGIRSSVNSRVGGMMGRKDSNDDRSNHVSRPLSDLKDPASFAPPPKRTGTGLTPGPKYEPEKRQVITAPSKYHDPRLGPPPKPGAQATGEAPATEQENEGLEDERSTSYRTNTTGLATDHFPRPPGRRDGADGRSPPSYTEATTTAPRAAPPSLPPRLPPRGATGSPVVVQRTNSPSSTGSGHLNESAVNRLGAAGVSVPALGIGRGSGGGSGTSSPSPTPAAAGSGKWTSQKDELQGRFAKLSTSSGSPSAQEPPKEGTTWAQKQAALKTASAFQKDPSSVSLSDAKAAASTANNFRQRHGDQVAAGVKTANNLNQKYGVSERVGAYAGRQNTPPALPGPTLAYTGAPSEDASPASSGSAAKKKPPPPPPKKKPGLKATNSPSGSQYDEPPPIPLSTRPSF